MGINEPSSADDEDAIESCSHEINIKNKENVEKVPPDGGWGWMVLLGSVVIMALGTFPKNVFSILFSPVLMSQGVSSTKIAWIFNLNRLIMNINIFLVYSVCDEFGHRKIGLFGGITVFVSMILSAFAVHPNILFLSFGFLGGIGMSCTVSLPILIVSKYFKKRRGFATSVTLLGSSVNSFMAPPVANYLLQNYGYKGASLICAAIVLNQCIGVMLYQPVEWHMKPIKGDQTKEVFREETISDQKIAKNKTHSGVIEFNRSGYDYKIDASSSSSTDWETQSINKSSVSHLHKHELKRNFKNNSKDNKIKNIFMRTLKSTLKNFKVLKYMRVHVITLANSGLFVGYFNFVMWIPFVIIDAGYSLEMAAWCTSFVAISYMSGAALISIISDRKFCNLRYGYIFGLFLTGSSITVFAFVKDIKFYILLCCICGFSLGLSISLQPLSLIDVMGLEIFPAVVGISHFSLGFVCIIIGTITGAIRDATSDFTHSLLILAGCIYLGLCLWILMPWVEKFDKKMYQKVDDIQEAEDC